MNLERSTWQLHHALAVEPSLQHTRDDGGARAGTARQRDARAALPHAHLHIAAVHHLYELGVGARGKDGEILKQAADLRQRDVCHLEVLAVLAEDHVVRVAHAHQRRCPRRPRHLDLRLDHLAVGRVGLQRRRDLGGLEDRKAHVHRHVAIGSHRRLNKSRHGIHFVARRRLPINVSDKPGEAANPIPAHLRLATIRVEDAHRVIRGPFQSRQSENDAVPANAEVAIAQLDRLFCGDLWRGIVPIVYEDEVVAKALILGELHRSRHAGGHAKCGLAGRWL
mmetsp:Transcript_11484/g.19612  ORF Transcript_11484/g.19612 Transcript_11484/m.19612 type:complete len:280 (+) Transcript_11484:480-1319(+)